MVSLLVVFYIFIGLFAIIGAMRGWVKELLVIFSVILALAFITILENLIPFTKDMIVEGSTGQFWLRAAIVASLAFFGYQSPKITRLSEAVGRRDKIQDFILGLLFGVVSGYMIVGTLWSYMNAAGYPFKPYMTAPANDPTLGKAAEALLGWLPPAIVLGQQPWIYIVVVFSFIFVIVVFI
jgi:hypothetical protein